jgi:predicted DNA-binding transcriptional regulator AlpA
VIHPERFDIMNSNLETTVQLPRLLNQQDLADYIGKSTKWCERARWAGEGPAFVKLGHHVRYKAEDVAAWIEECASKTNNRGA